MKELLLLGAVGVFVWLLRDLMGPPVRRRPHEARISGPNPEADMPMADTPIILDTGQDTGQG